MSDKLTEVEQKITELETAMADPANVPKLRALAREHGFQVKVADRYRRIKNARESIEEAEKILADKESDDDFKALAREDLEELRKTERSLETDLLTLLADQDEPHAENAIVEIRAGTGGEEACLFAGDLYTMYERYITVRGWKMEVMHLQSSDLDGFKEIVFEVTGKDAYHSLRFESGGHRVQRVPKTEAAGRIHTSAATVAVMPEVEEVDVEINPSDLKWETFRASGPGGQKVNKTSSAVRITHLPTGLVVSCQDEKSQHKNRARAMKILRSRIFEHFRQAKKSARDQQRRTLIGSGDRNERIRTYNFPQNRLTDHRINLTLYNLDRIMLGELNLVIDALTAFDREEALKKLQ